MFLYHENTIFSHKVFTSVWRTTFYKVCNKRLRSKSDDPTQSRIPYCSLKHFLRTRSKSTFWLLIIVASGGNWKQNCAIFRWRRSRKKINMLSQNCQKTLRRLNKFKLMKNLRTCLWANISLRLLRDFDVFFRRKWPISH